MTIEVTEEHRRTYERDGVVLLRNVISERWIETLRAGVDKGSGESISDLRGVRSRSAQRGGWPVRECD